MKLHKVMIMLGVFGLLFTSCEKDDEDFTNNFTGEVKEVVEESPDQTKSDIEVEEFIYKGMNEIYLYKADVETLADSYFSTDAEKTEFLENVGSPEDLFEGIKSSADRFSFLTDDYFALEDRFNGVSGSTGIKFGLGRISGTNNVFAYLQYILPGTSAEEAGLTRGTVFTEVDGKKLTISNFSELLEADSFTINVGRVEGGILVLTDETVTLTNNRYTANPVYLTNTLDMDGKKIGYLMYNSFIGDFDDELNAAFAQLKSEGVTELILDLRYNGGGSVESAVDLASMITGQFEGEVFIKEQWNKKYQDYFEAKKPEGLLNRFDPKIRTEEAINSLNLSRVYVLTSESTASASELVINGLEPYIDVVQVGTNTTGKFQASVTLYDSPDFEREEANENHTYAIQPLVFKSANSAGKSDYLNGLTPDVKYSEDINNLGTLGEPTEPLVQAALNHLLGKSQGTKSAASRKAAQNFEIIGENGMNEPNYQRMYIDKVPFIL